VALRGAEPKRPCCWTGFRRIMPDGIRALGSGMDREAQIQAIEEDLDVLQGLPVGSDQSARDALAHAMVTVRRINQLLAQAQAQALMGAGAPVDDVLAKLRKWVDQLVTELARIVGKLTQATSSSISVGAALSVTVHFGPSASQ
jgi:hypothetical protein